MRLLHSFKNLLISGLLVVMLTGCASMSNMFGGDNEEETRLKGERISIMELQTRLEPEDNLSDASYDIPEPWKNDFWPQQGGYPNHAMHNPALGDSPLKQIWSVSIGRGSTSELPLTALPVMIDDRVYTLDTNSNLSAFALEDGARLWRTDISKADEHDEVIGGGIAASRGKIYASNGFDQLVKLDGKTGEIEWRVNLPSAVRAAPTVLSGRVFVQTMGDQLLALAASDGDLLWTHQAIGETSGLLGARAPAANRDIVVPGYSSGEIFALRLENGGVAWQDNLAPRQRLGGMGSLSDIQAPPILDRGLVIAISFGGRLVGIDQRTGRRVWQRQIGGSEMPWVAGESIFVLSSQNRLVSFERQTGNIRWVRDLPKYENPEKQKNPLVFYGPVMAGGRLIVTASDSKVFEFDPTTGEDLETWDASGPLAGPPIVAAQTLFLLTERGRLEAYQ